MSSAMDHGQRISDAMKKTVNDLDVKYLRRMQADMHRCAAKCCDNPSDSVERVHACVENCSVTLNQAQNYIQNEFQNVQSRLSRCVMQCNDDIKDKMGVNPNESEVSRYTKEFDSCAVKCVDQQINSSLPSLMIRMQQVLSSQQFPQ